MSEEAQKTHEVLRALIIVGFIFMMFGFMVLAMVTSKGRGSERGAHGFLKKLEAEKILEKSPNDYQALVRLGDYYQESRHRPEALSIYSKAIAADPNSPQAYLRRAIIFDSMHEFDRAKVDRERAAMLDR